VSRNPGSDKAKWMWIISNTSLVVPVIIAAIFIILFSIYLKDRNLEIDKQYQKLYEIQNELIKNMKNQSNTKTTIKP
jgi:F0F1-type ATP synthase membrane subunit a